MLGTRDYLGKNRFSKAVIGLSGGIDSALTAAIAVEALGADRVVGVSMPSRFNSGETRGDAGRVAENLGIRFLEIPIQGVYEGYLELLADPFDNGDPGVADENLQARIRGNILMALSNKFGWLVLTTGNKSEIAVGYCTLYGDMAGGFAVIKDVPKTLVWELAANANRHAGREVIPASTIARVPPPSCGRTSATRTRCRPTTCSTRSSPPTSRSCAPREEIAGRASTRGRSSGSSAWWTAPSTSGGRPRRA